MGDEILSGACRLCCPPTLPSDCFPAPIPPPPSQREGGDQGYFMQGASPLASPGMNPSGTGTGRQTTRPAGGLPSLPPAYPAFSVLSFPHPPAPFPTGRGRSRLFYARGFAPCIPGAEPGRRWSSLPYRYPCGGLVRLVACSTCHCGTKRECLPSLSPVYTAFSFCCCPIPPPSQREGGDQGYFMQGASPPAPRH